MAHFEFPLRGDFGECCGKRRVIEMRVVTETSGAASRVDDLTLDFDDRHPFAPGHYAFLVDDSTFDRAIGRLRQPDSHVEFGAGPGAGWNREINRLNGGRGVYVRDPDGHSYELFTTVPE